ncbi:unnamed protein product [Taenia asiatica]|uniref:Cytochrome b5 heme-binding domain-containing protein n=1 Tax=Taenia asiatica TaxID=60517 RepID=A0A0R3VSW7_TAEAS|nr:unnamed protein product [Taenia asiatica]
MRKVGVLVALFLAILVSRWRPDHGVRFNLAWETVRLHILDTMNALIDANSRLLAPLFRLFRFNSIYPASTDENDGPFKLPRCLRNPIAPERLEKYKHLAILGHVFDVSSNQQIYGPNGIYAFLTGRDATRMLVSEDMQDSGLEAYALDGLTSAQLYELGDWLKLYTRKYPCMGYIPSVYRSPMGDASDLLIELQKAWNKRSPESLDFSELLPPCSSFFDGKILRLTCNLYVSDTSEELYPRQLLEPEKAKMRCACVPKSHLTHPRLRLYPGCSDITNQCLIKIDDPENVWTSRLASIEAI